MSLRQPQFHETTSCESNEFPSTHPHAHHIHAQSTFDVPKLRSPTNDRNASVDFGGTSSSSQSIPPLGSQQTKKHPTRTSIITAPSGQLTPLSTTSNQQRSDRARTVTHAFVESNQVSEHQQPASANGMSRSPSSDALSTAISGSLSERDRTPVERRSQQMTSSASMRSLSPLRTRPTMLVGQTTNTKNSGRDVITLSPSNASSNLASFAHLSMHSSNTVALMPSSNPSQVTTLPNASGIVVALHVSGQTFLTTPETLLRVIQLEGKSSGNDLSLLQWIGEDVFLKHREASNDLTARTPGGGANATSSPGGFSSMQKRKQTGDNSSEPSPRSSAFPPPAFTTSATSSPTSSSLSPPAGVSSSIHNGPSLSFHAPTYSYFLDRNPASFDLILDYLRDGAGAMKERLRNVTDTGTLHSLCIEAEHFGLGVLFAVVRTEVEKRAQMRFLSEDDLFWTDCVQKIDGLFPQDALPMVTGGGAPVSPSTNGVRSDVGTPAGVGGNGASAGGAASPKGASSSGSPRPPLVPQLSLYGSSLTTRQNLQKNIGSMLRRLAFQRDPMLRVCHATYRHTHEYPERLLEILHTSCTLCQRKIYFKPIGLREGRDTGCPVHPASGQWDRKARMWSCCGSPDFNNSGCQFTGIHYTTWTFINSTD